MSKWQKDFQKEYAKEKFIKSPIDLCINIETPPKEVTREGKWGKRTLYLVVDTKLGIVCLNPKQFMVVAEAIGDLIKGTINVTV